MTDRKLPEEKQCLVFFVDLARLHQDEMFGCLSSSEVVKADSFTHHGARIAYIKMRGALRTVLGYKLSTAPADLNISIGDHGKPCLKQDGTSLEFSLAGSEEIGAIALSKLPIGIDLEYLGAPFEWQCVAQSQFHRREVAAINAIPADARRDAFYKIWAQKEAVLKACGTGFMADPTEFFVPLNGGKAEWEARSKNTDWFSVLLRAPNGNVAALASPISGIEITTPTLKALKLPTLFP